MFDIPKCTTSVSQIYIFYLLPSFHRLEVDAGFEQVNIFLVKVLSDKNQLKLKFTEHYTFHHMISNKITVCFSEVALE